MGASPSTSLRAGYARAAAERTPVLQGVPIVAAVVLIANSANIHNSLTLWGAWLYLLGRIVYLPLYAFGVRYVRSLVWNVAALGIFLILSGIARGA